MERKLSLPINVMSRHVIHCQLQELREHLLPAGQKPPYYCLQVICSTVPSTQLSHTTLQFIRYATLLHNAKKLKHGELDEHILNSILINLINISKAPELGLEPLQAALGSLIMDTKSGLSKDGVDKYWRKLVAFVEMVLHCYSVSPEIEKYLSGDAFAAKIPTRCNRLRNPGKNNILNPTKQQKLTSELGPFVVVINPTSDGSYPSDLLFNQADEAAITSPAFVAPVPSKAEKTQEPVTYDTATTRHIGEAQIGSTTRHIGEAQTGSTTRHIGEAQTGSTTRQINKAGTAQTTQQISEAGTGHISQAGTGHTTHCISATGIGRAMQHISRAGTGQITCHISATGISRATQHISQAGIGQTTHCISATGIGRASQAGTGRTAHHICEAGTITQPISQAGTSHTTHHINQAGTSINIHEIKVEGVATGRRGIFDTARASSSEMEWTSDESDYIAPLTETVQGLPRPLFSIECGDSFTTLFKQSPPKTFRKKWSEEEHACLVEGVRILGEGKWKEIKNMYREVLKDRDTVHLKDRFRNTEGKRGKRKDILRIKEQETVGNT